MKLLGPTHGWTDGASRLRWTCATGLLVWFAFLAIVYFSGCHRGRYREQADADAYRLVHEKSQHPHWPLNDFTINIDERSRMYSPDHPDRQPMPPDDPTSHRLMRRVDNKPGYPGWDANGHTPFVENPDWLSFVPLNEKGVLQVNSVNAVKGLIEACKGIDSSLA